MLDLYAVPFNIPNSSVLNEIAVSILDFMERGIGGTAGDLISQPSDLGRGFRGLATGQRRQQRNEQGQCESFHSRRSL